MMHIIHHRNVCKYCDIHTYTCDFEIVDFVTSPESLIPMTQNGIWDVFVNAALKVTHFRLKQKDVLRERHAVADVDCSPITALSEVLYSSYTTTMSRKPINFFYLKKNKQTISHTFCPLVVTFNVVERIRNQLASVISYVITAIESLQRRLLQKNAK